MFIIIIIIFIFFNLFILDCLFGLNMRVCLKNFIYLRFLFIIINLLLMFHIGFGFTTHYFGIIIIILVSVYLVGLILQIYINSFVLIINTSLMNLILITQASFICLL